MTERLLAQLDEQRPVRGLVFKRPWSGDASGRSIEFSGERFRTDIRLSPPRNTRWKLGSFRRPGEDSLGAEDLLGYIAPVLRPGLDRDEAVGTLLDEAWEASAEIKMPGGTRRLINVGERQAHTMSFPIGDAEGEGDVRERPTDDEIAQAVREAIDFFTGQYTIDAASSADLSVGARRMARWGRRRCLGGGLE